jgi:hypothetical protein
MKLLRKRDIPEEKYSNAFLGYGPEESHFVVELTYSQCAQSLGVAGPPPPRARRLYCAVCGFQVPDLAESIHRLRG